MRSSALGVMLAASLLSPGAADAAVFYARDEALELAFPSATRIEPVDFFLSPSERAAIESAAATELASDLLTLYRGYDGERPLGYAIIDTRLVRTLPETLLVVLTPEGRVRRAELLAFYEPLEYRPPARWLARFDGVREPASAHVGVGVDAISGATFTTHATAAAVRRALAIYAVLLAPKAQ